MGACLHVKDDHKWQQPYKDMNIVYKSIDTDCVSESCIMLMFKAKVRFDRLKVFQISKSKLLINLDEILTAPAENVNNGTNMIPSFVSGYWVQTYPNTPIIAPDWGKKHTHI